MDLGMESGSIPDNKINASSEINANTVAKNGRLNYAAGPSWCAAKSDSNPYLQIDLQTLHIICAVSTQGNSRGNHWVKTYKLQLSTNGSTWTYYKDDGQVKVRVRGRTPASFNSFNTNQHRDGETFCKQKLQASCFSDYLLLEIP